MPSAQAGREAFNVAAAVFFRNQGWKVLEKTTGPLAGDMIIGIIVSGYTL